MIAQDYEIPQLVQKARDAGAETIVYTNGCFDLLHPGHVVSLQAIASLGDFLVVGVNSPYSVHRLKGPGRPVYGSHDRLLMLDALACVNLVYQLPGDTPRQDLRDIRPDILAKGGTTPEIVGESIVRAYGGTVAQVPAYENYSTSGLIEQILERFGELNECSGSS